MSSPEQNRESLKQVIEALIFGANHPVTLQEIYETLSHDSFEEYEFDLDGLPDVVNSLIREYKEADCAFEIRKVSGGMQFFTRERFYPFLKQAQIIKDRKKISRAAMETLAIIAYRQPVTKTEMEFIRGVNCDYAVQKLLERKLVEILGRSEAPGRPLLYGTSSYFMEHFGLESVNDLPKLEEVNIDADTYQEQFKVFLEEKDEGHEVLDKRKEGGENGEA